MDMRKKLIAHAVIDLFGAKNIIERNDAPIRRAEGLELRSGVLEGPALPGPILIEINGTPRRTSLQLERSEEHTSELQSHVNLVCRLLLEKKKKKTKIKKANTN